MSYAALAAHKRKADEARRKKLREKTRADHANDQSDDREDLMSESGRSDKSGKSGKSSKKSPHDREYGQAIDLILVDTKEGLKERLKAYDCLYWLINGGGKYPTREFSLASNAVRFVQLPFPEQGERISRDKILETGCIDWCVANAFAAQSDLIGKYVGDVNNKILVSTLLLSVTTGLYLEPPTFDIDMFNILFSALLGLSTFIQLFNTVAFTAVASLINSGYTPSLTFLARVEADFYMAILNALVYVGVVMFMCALFFVAYVGNVIDLYIMLLVFPLIILFVYILVKTIGMSEELRRETAWQFYERFCEADGKLLPKYLDLVYSDVETFEEQMNENDDDFVLENTSEKGVTKATDA